MIRHHHNGRRILFAGPAQFARHTAALKAERDVLLAERDEARRQLELARQQQN